MTDLRTSFDLEQLVTAPTCSRGHTLDWLIHRPSENLLESTEVIQALESDQCCVLSRLRVAVPPPPPAIIRARNFRSIVRQAFKVELNDRLSALELSAAEVDQSLRTVLDQHTPATHRKVPALCSSPWFNAVADDLR